MKLSEMPKSENVKQKSQKEETKNESVGINKGSAKGLGCRKKDIRAEYESLKGCSSQELMSKLAQEVQQQKTSGTFDYDSLKNSVEQIKIYLPTQTYENMLRIIESLK